MQNIFSVPIMVQQTSYKRCECMCLGEQPNKQGNGIWQDTMFWQISCLAFDQPFILDLNINHLKTNSTQKEACNLLKATKSYVFSRTSPSPFTKPNSPCLVTFAISNEITRFLLHLLCHWALKTGAKYLSSTICCSEDKSKFPSQNSVRWVQKRSQNTHNRMWQRWEYLHKYNMWSNEFWQVL